MLNRGRQGGRGCGRAGCRGRSGNSGLRRSCSKRSSRGKHGRALLRCDRSSNQKEMDVRCSPSDDNFRRRPIFALAGSQIGSSATSKMRACTSSGSDRMSHCMSPETDELSLLAYPARSSVDRRIAQLALLPAPVNERETWLDLLSTAASCRQRSNAVAFRDAPPRVQAYRRAF
jgi:hypothetical protein